jgi:hypothetical protein
MFRAPEVRAFSVDARMLFPSTTERGAADFPPFVPGFEASKLVCFFVGAMATPFFLFGANLEPCARTQKRRSREDFLPAS